MIPELLTPAGLLAYYLFILSEQTRAGAPVNPILFIKNRPYKTGLSVLCAYLGYLLVQLGLDPENGSEALILGVMGYITDLTNGSIPTPKNIPDLLLDVIHWTALVCAGFIPFLIADKYGKKYAK